LTAGSQIRVRKVFRESLVSIRAPGGEFVEWV
jgi:hypothetical protein